MDDTRAGQERIRYHPDVTVAKRGADHSMNELGRIYDDAGDRCGLYSPSQISASSSRKPSTGPSPTT